MIIRAAKKFLGDIQAKNLLTKVNQNRNSEVNRLTISLKSEEAYIKNELTSIETRKKRIAEYKTKIKNTKDDLWTLDDLKSSLDILKNHKFVDWAVLTPQLELIVQTKMLEQFDALDGKSYNTKVGRYAFKINVNDIISSSYNSDPIHVHALDFVSQSYRHPNIMTHPTHTCWGGYDSTVKNMVRQGEFFNAIDGLINFFSSFPHEGGHRPQYWLVWLNERKVAFQKNPWFDKTELYTIGTKTEPKEMKLRIVKKLTAKIGKEEYSLEGLNFRNF